MKAAILTNRDASFCKPLAEGLSRMFSEIGVESMVLYDGVASLPKVRVPDHPLPSGWRNKLIWILEEGYSWLSYCRLIRDLRAVDFVVIVGHVPCAYLEAFFDDKRLRRDVPRLPIILYDLHYLPTRGYWAKWILENNATRGIPKGRHWGPDRYDYHLCLTEVSEWPVPSGAEMFSRIGVNLVDPSLVVEAKKPLVALIDFERPDYLYERAIQVHACVEAGIPFKVLHGHYSIDDIRAIYRSCSLYFVAHRESFGLPICEVQACGAMVLSPYPHWCPSHYLERSEGGGGRLPKNFIIYNNDKERLVSELKRIKREFNAEEVFTNFKRDSAHFYRGDVAELARFVNLVKDGVVNAHTHKQYPTLSQLVQAIGELPPLPV